METAKPPLIRETFPVGPLQCNCTIIGDPISKKAIVVDPGGNPELILARLDALGLKVVSIIHTHAHLDHFLASGQLKEKTGATLHLHKEDQFLWDNLEMQCQMFRVPYTPVPSPDRWLEHDEALACGCGVALHTPGHTPGSMSFWFADANLMIINKIDLLPYLDFDIEQCIHYARQVNPEIQVIALSASSGEGMDMWLEWLEAQRCA